MFEPARTRNNIPLNWNGLYNWRDPQNELVLDVIRTRTLPLFKDDNWIVVNPEGSFLSDGPKGRIVVNGGQPALPEIPEKATAEEKREIIEEQKKKLKVVMWASTYGANGSVYFGPNAQQQNFGKVYAKSGMKIGIMDAVEPYINSDGYTGASGKVHGDGVLEFLVEPIFSLGRWIVTPKARQGNSEEIRKENVAEFAKRLREMILCKYCGVAADLATEGLPADPASVWEGMEKGDQACVPQRMFSKFYWKTYREVWQYSPRREIPVPKPLSTTDGFPTISGNALCWEIGQ